MQVYYAVIFLTFLQISVTSVVGESERRLKHDAPLSADWWKTAVIYQIYPRSFMDSDGDGVGDIQGIIKKLPHLQDAGVTAAWVSSIFKSPQVDQGHDISDYNDIDPDYGTVEDLKEFLEKAKELGIKIILDFVPNHTSDQHDLFKKSVANETGYEDYYVWHSGKIVDDVRQPPNNWLSEYGGSAWEFNEDRLQYYYHKFSSKQPDLNYSNPNVVEAVKDVLKYWLNFGVDGFVVNDASYLVEDSDFKDEPLLAFECTDSTDSSCLNHIYTKDLPSTYELIYQFREVLDDFDKVIPRVLITEADTSVEKQMLYYGTSDRSGAHFTFNYIFISSLHTNFTVEDIVTGLKSWLTQITLNQTNNWVLGNHNSHRLATRLGIENVDGFNMLAAFLPGVLVTYNGEEIGMENGEVTCEQGHDSHAISNCSSFHETSRDFERTPFHWDGSKNAGFTTGIPWLPVSIKATEVNLAAQSIFGVSSHYNLYKELVMFRKNFQEALYMDKTSSIKLNETVLQVMRHVDDDEFVLLFNVGEGEQEVDFFRTKDIHKVVLASGESLYKSGAIVDLYSPLKLDPHECVILKGFDEF